VSCDEPVIDEAFNRFTTSLTLTARGGYNFVLYMVDPDNDVGEVDLFFEAFTTHLFPKTSQITHLSKNSWVER
jgi:hypothetical protein